MEHPDSVPFKSAKCLVDVIECGVSFIIASASCSDLHKINAKELPGVALMHILLKKKQVPEH